jgi:hypothetical protein
VTDEEPISTGVAGRCALKKPREYAKKDMNTVRANVMSTTKREVNRILD